MLKLSADKLRSNDTRYDRAIRNESSTKCFAIEKDAADAICRLNSEFAQGMSVAAQETVILRRLLADRARIVEHLMISRRPFC